MGVVALDINDDALADLETTFGPEVSTANVDMGDEDGARSILGEVIAEGNAAQKDDAQKLLDQLG